LDKLLSRSIEYDSLLQFNNKNIDYLFLVPWLLVGGADLEALNYIKAMTDLHPEKNIIVMATGLRESTWLDRLPQNVKFLDFGNNFRHIPREDLDNMLYQYILDTKPKVIHNINSASAYRLFINHGKELSKYSNLFVTTFCPDYTKDGKLENWTTKYLPDCFEYLSGVFIDNKAFIDMLIDMFEFDRSKFNVHHQPIKSYGKNKYENKIPAKKTLDILWAGRISRQKRPDILAEIAKRAQNLPLKFHVYGSINVLIPDDDYISHFKNLTNLSYYGPFDNFYSIDKSNYDVLLCTSQWEGLPNILLESMSCGIPVVSSNVGGISELITHNETGFLVDPFDNIDKYIEILMHIYENSEILEDIVNNAYKKIDMQHSWESFIEMLTNNPEYSCL